MAISEIFIQVADVSLGLQRQGLGWPKGPNWPRGTGAIDPRRQEAGVPQNTPRGPRGHLPLPSSATEETQRDQET